MPANRPHARHRAPRPPVRGPRLRRSAVAFLASAALAMTGGLPALADAPEKRLGSDGGSFPAQTFRVRGAAGVDDVRDSYGVLRAGTGSGQLSYSRVADTFVNNPASPIQWPFQRGVPISSGFGSRTPPCSGCSAFHQGIDMTPGLGTPVQAIADGVVSAVGGPRGSLGAFVRVDHMIDGRRVQSLYAHMLAGSSTLRVGDRLVVGQQVGLVGDTGQSTGAHLHLGILLDGTTPTDPFAWLTARVRLS